jgi:orotate phosphoribosyltransferase
VSSSSPLPPHKAEPPYVAINGGVLKFGNFELKSKRILSYFFSAGDFYGADLLRAISTAYAKREAADKIRKEGLWLVS